MERGNPMAGRMRFHAPTDNTNNYLPMHAANNFPYGAPPVLENNVMEYNEPTWDDVPEKFTNHDDHAAKCFSCKGWFPVSSCVINHGDYGEAIPVCETCADGKFWPKPDGNNTDPWEYGEQP